MWRRFVVVLAVSATCSWPFASVPAASSETGVTGTVRLWPAFPGAQRAGDPGTASYAGALVKLRDARGTIVGSQRTDADGRFRMPAAQGSYDVFIKGAALPRCKAVGARVKDGRMTNVDITCDSGMR